MPDNLTVADSICQSLIDLGVEVVFGIPGTQTVPLYDAIRRSSLRSILSMTETTAAFQACGYYATAGKTPLLCVTPGPGFQMALAGISEAREDSLAMLVLTTTKRRRSSDSSEHRHLEAEQFAKGVAKKYIRLDTADSLGTSIRNAYTTAIQDEPGPVVIEIDEDLLWASVDHQPQKPASPTSPPLDRQTIVSAVERIRAAQRPLFICGRGCARASSLVTSLASSLGIPVITTSSGRGTIPESHPFACCVEYCSNAIDMINELLGSSDLVLALGNKFSANSSGENEMEILPEKLIHVNCDTTYTNSRYAGALTIRADVLEFLTTIAPELADSCSSQWTAQEIAAVREEFLSGRTSYVSEVLSVFPEGYADWSEFFHTMRRALPENTIVITDSGAHQYITRNHWTVMKPASFIVPVGFQAMGFGIPAAVGAKLGNPRKPVVVITGDGGFHMVGMETLASVRESLPISIIVFRDDSLGLIRHQQWRDCGWESSTALLNPDFGRLAESFGIEYLNLSKSPDQLEPALTSIPQATRILELRVRPSLVARRKQLTTRTKSIARRSFGEKFFGFVKRTLARR